MGLQSCRKSGRNLFFLFALSFAVITSASNAATFTVSNTADSGVGSLRQAIIDANSLAGLDTISFNISGAGIKTITPTSALPAITDPVIIDGASQPGYAGTPLIQINGASSGSNAGLRLLSGGSTVRGLILNRFPAQGIYIRGSGSNHVAGCFIGTDASGTAASPNNQGVWIDTSTANLVGGTNAADRNVLSGNSGSGIYILNSSSNVIQGNFIGTAATGTSRLPNNDNGISISASQGNLVGGPAPGARNIIAGNYEAGLVLDGTVSSGNTIQGNFIGIGANGSTVVSNRQGGILIQGAPDNLIGGTNAGAGNVISGNGTTGILISGASAAGNSILGNLVGTDPTGKIAAGNDYAGITMLAARNNHVGGSTPAARNVISANKAGGILLSTNSTANFIAGNLVGLDITGTNPLGNLGNGITLCNAHSNFVGSTTSGARNVISGNSSLGKGIEIVEGSTFNTVQGNYIGCDASGSAPRANAGAGIGISWSRANTIGGATPGAGNVISGNADSGLFLWGNTASANIIQGNKIGTDASGLSPLPNAKEGIYLQMAVSNIIGGPLPGAGNVISANGTWGLFLTNTAWNSIQGNVIGAGIDRVTPLGNSTAIGSGANKFHTIELEKGARENTIGGIAENAGNVIAYTPAYNGINYAGVRVRPGVTNNAILGNSFFANAGLGIDLAAYQVTPNDDCDADAGAQNFPLLAEAFTGSGTGVRGAAYGKANTPLRLEFFANPSCHPSGHGEGKLFLGSAYVTTDASCVASFIAPLPRSAPPGHVITATATDPYNNSSEFSSCLTTRPVPTLSFSLLSEHTLQLSWPVDSTGFKLVQTDRLFPPPVIWTPVTNEIIVSGSAFQLSSPMSEPQRFYRLSFE